MSPSCSSFSFPLHLTPLPPMTLCFLIIFLLSLFFFLLSFLLFLLLFLSPLPLTSFSSVSSPTQLYNHGLKGLITSQTNAKPL
jgi:hypothetical protein